MFAGKTSPLIKQGIWSLTRMVFGEKVGIWDEMMNMRVSSQTGRVSLSLPSPNWNWRPENGWIVPELLKILSQCQISNLFRRPRSLSLAAGVGIYRFLPRGVPFWVRDRFAFYDGVKCGHPSVNAVCLQVIISHNAVKNRIAPLLFECPVLGERSH
uniref:Uncharacterized protein n=1 Tax=Steinernema glaseri TaxID=37863 RepID=A0A1I7ZB04_9BILA